MEGFFMRLLKANEFNKEANINATNCFAFALGLTENGGRYELPRKDVDGCNVKIAEAFKYRAAYNNIMLREVLSLEETRGKVAFILFGWFSLQIFMLFERTLMEHSSISQIGKSQLQRLNGKNLEKSIQKTIMFLY